MDKRFGIGLWIIILLISASGCSEANQAPMDEQEPIKSSTPTNTSIPTATYTPTPIPIPTEIPTATPDPLENLGTIFFQVIDIDDGVYNYQYFHQAANESESIIWEAQAEGMREAAWSPDGSRVAFVADWDGDDEIYVMNSDGSEITQLTFNKANDWGPDWSPDGEQIAFASQRDPIPNYEGPPPEIYVMDADGSNQTRLTNNEFSNHSPSWSPDGQRIAFSSDHYSFDMWSRINIMNSDGSGVTILVDLPESDLGPQWSPDGTRIAFISQSMEVNAIYLINSDGSGLEQLKRGSADYSDLAWSPDGAWLIYVLSGGKSQDLYLYSLESGKNTRFTYSSDVNEFYPVWVEWRE